MRQGCGVGEMLFQMLFRCSEKGEFLLFFNGSCCDVRACQLVHTCVVLQVGNNVPFSLKE